MENSIYGKYIYIYLTEVLNEEHVRLHAIVYVETLY